MRHDAEREELELEIAAALPGTVPKQSDTN